MVGVVKVSSKSASTSETGTWNNGVGGVKFGVATDVAILAAVGDIIPCAGAGGPGVATKLEGILPVDCTKGVG